MQNQELKPEQARERLQLNQTRHEPIPFAANSEINDEKIWVSRFVWDF